jgi:glutathione S-transferase
MAEQSIDYVSLRSLSGSKSREILRRLGGKDQVPFLVDVDEGVMMYESSDIIEYLKKNA